MAAAAKKGEASFKQMGDAVTSKLGKVFAAAAIIDGFRRLLGAINDNVEEIKDLGDQMGMTVEEVQKLGIAADRAALGMGGVQTALRKIDDLRAAAATGEKKAVSLFSLLGIDPSKGTSLDILKTAVEASSKGAREQAALFDLVGKKANQLKLVVNELNDLGPVKLVDETSAQIVDDFGNQLKDLKREFMAEATTTSAPFFGMVSRILKRGRQLDAEGKSFALSRAILEESYGSGAPMTDTSALPLPPKNAIETSVQSDAKNAATPDAIALGLQADALSRIGLFVGGRGDAGNQLVSIGNYQLSELRAIRAGIEHANR